MLNFMDLILYYNYVRCYRGLVGEGYMRHSIFAASCESITISKLKVKKKYSDIMENGRGGHFKNQFLQ